MIILTPLRWKKKESVDCMVSRKKAKKKLSFSANLLAFYVRQTILSLTQPDVYKLHKNSNFVNMFLNFFCFGYLLRNENGPNRQ